MTPSLPRAYSLRLPALILFALIAFASGCVTHRHDPLPDRTASEFPNREQQKQFFLGARITTESFDSKRYFGRDLPALGFYPVVIYLQNRSESDDFEVREISFRVPGVGPFTSVPPEQVFEKAYYSQWRSAPLYLFAIVPGVLSSINIANANLEMLTDYKDKVLTPQILESRDSRGVSGVRFFAPPVGAAQENLDPRKGLLEVKLTRIPNDSTQPSEELSATFVFQQ